MKLNKNKKGFVGDYILVVVFLFVFAIFFIVIFFAWDKVNDGWQGAGLGDTSEKIMDDFITKFPAVWDWVFVFWVIGFIIIMVVLGTVLKTNPVFIGLALIVLTIIAGMISVYFANAYDDLAGTTEFIPAATSFNKMTFIMQNYPYIIVILSAIVIIAMFAKKNDGGFGI